MATTYTITVQSTAEGNKYFIDGVQQDSLTLQAGESYIFDQSDASNTGHPLALSETDNGTHGGGSEYIYNITKVGTTGTDGLLYFSPDNETTTSLYYYCQVHSGMGGGISVSPQTQIDPQVNFFKSTLAGTYSATDTSFTIATGDGAKLPDPSVDGEYNLTIFEGLQVTNSTTFEIVRVIDRAGDSLTVNRGIEGTSAFSIGSATHSILMSATKKVFSDIDTQIENVEAYDQTLNTTSDVAFNSVDVENTFLLPIKTSLPSSGTLGEMFYYSPKESMVFYDGSHFKQIDASYLLGLGVATAQVTANGITLEVDSDFAIASATASANDATTTFLSSASRSLGLATATASANDGSANFLVIDVEYLVIAGGAGGADYTGNGGFAGGGGAGGYRSSVSGESSGGGASAESPLELDLFTNYTVTVGAGGGRTSNGSNSSAFGIVSVGGGTGGNDLSIHGKSGGSGGGGNPGFSERGNGGSGTTGQGYPGGRGKTNGSYPGGGGGGAGQSGASGDGTGAGGNGVASSITGTSIYRAGGGGGGDFATADPPGGLGGGGKEGQSGQANTGGGGGGGGLRSDYIYQRSGSGGSGVVILRYPSDKSINIGAGLSGSETTVGANKVATITSGTGNISFS